MIFCGIFLIWLMKLVWTPAGRRQVHGLLLGLWRNFGARVDSGVSWLFGVSEDQIWLETDFYCLGDSGKRSDQEDSSTVFIKNLPYDTNEDEVADFF